MRKIDTMLFEDYKFHPDAKVRPSLLWEFDLNRFNWQSMRDIVVQRVLERGRMDDFYAILNLYGEEGTVLETARLYGAARVAEVIQKHLQQNGQGPRRIARYKTCSKNYHPSRSYV